MAGQVKITAKDVTVVITTIPGRSELLDRAYRSVQKQEWTPKCAVIYYDEARMGAHHARNAAIEKVDTEFVAFLDDDDEFLPNHIKKMVQGANVSGADLIYTYAEFHGMLDPLAVMIDGQVRGNPIDVPWSSKAEYSLRNFGNFIPVTNLVRTSAIRAVGGFPAPHSFPAKVSGECEDYGLLIRLLDAGYTFFHVVGVRTWRYHVWGGNTGGRGAATTQGQPD